MALQIALEFLENPSTTKFFEAVEETARLSATGNGFTLSLYPAAAVASALAIVSLAPLFSKIPKMFY